MRPVVAVVGRPNVGKSTLVNRILGRREAIVEERPGVTRDRKAVTAEWQGRRFTLLDTGGWVSAGNGLEAKVSAQAEQAAREADAVLFVVDAVVGVTREDEQVARLLYSLDAPVLVVANKIDHSGQADAAWSLLALGLGSPHPISALHGHGTGDLLEAVLASIDAARAGPTQRRSPEGPAPGPVSSRLDAHGSGALKGSPEGSGASARPRAASASAPDPGAADPGEAPTSGSESNPVEPSESASVVDDTSPVQHAFSVVLVGRPNAGKSTLFNRLIGEDRSVVHDLPGTTRDSVDTIVRTEQGLVRFVDTAGMRRRSRIDSGVEYYSLLRALRAVDAADVALLVVDAAVGVTHQDQRLAERVDAAGCPIVILLNKWDLLDSERRLALAAEVSRRLGFLGAVPVLRVCALTGKGVARLWPTLRAAVAEYRTRLPTKRVNDTVRAAQGAQPAPGGARILYATQVATDPPTFTLFANRELPRSYLRYIERRLREDFDLPSTAMKFRVRRRDG